jgi:HEAT repeat protein
MLIHSFILFFSLALQEPSQVSGAYRGPVDEAQLALLSQDFVENSAFARWQFWFENERDRIIRGEADFSGDAINEFGQYGDSEWHLDRNQLVLSSLPVLLEASVSRDSAVREAAILSLGRIAYPASDSYVIEATKDRASNVRQAAFIALGMIGTDPALNELLRNFKANKDIAMRSFAAFGLGLSGRVEAAAELNNYLGQALKRKSWSKESDLILSVLVAAKMNRRVDYTSNLLKICTAFNKKSVSPTMVYAAMDALASTNNSRSIGFLVENLFSRKEEVSIACIRALGESASTLAVDSIIKLFNSTNSSRIKGESYLALANIGDSKSVAFLAKFSPGRFEEEYVQTSWMLASGIAKVAANYSRIADTVVFGSDFNKHDEAKASRGGECNLRGAAALALGFYEAPAARVQLEKCLKAENTSGELRAYVATALGMLRTDAAAQILLKYADLFNESEQARRGFAAALGMCANPQTNSKLTELLIEDDSATVRWASAHAMASTRDQSSMTKIVEKVQESLNSHNDYQSVAHMVLGLGYLGDTNSGATLESMAASLDYGQDNALLTCLKSY